MGEELGLCEGCTRHLRVSESACPFCGRSRVASAARELVVAPLGLSRSALLALGATLALGAGCAAPQVVQPYGAPPRPTPTSAPERDAGVVDAAPRVIAIYGAPAYKPPGEEH